MTRSAARRPGAVQAEKSIPPAPPSSEAHADDPASSPVPASPIPWTWRIVLFLWATSFLCLLGYEWLSGILK